MFLSALACLSLSRNHRVLVASGLDSDPAAQYSLFLGDLASLGCNLTYATCESAVITLERFGQRLFDSVVFIAGGKSACFGPGSEELTRFLDNGGNAYFFSSSGDVHGQLARHFGLRLQPTAWISNLTGSRAVILRNFVAPPAVVSRSPPPLVYDGGFGTIDRANDFRFPIVTAGTEHVMNSSERIINNPVYAYDMLPIYALQGRSGGRVVFVHSTAFATDEAFAAKVNRDERLARLDKPTENGNRQLLRELSEYVTHYKGHVRFVNVTHFAADTGVAPVQYHIKQNVTVVAQLESVKQGEWVLDDGELQVEVFMLGTFVRRHMKKLGNGKFEETLMLPDRAGNFKIKVFTNREGWVNAREEMAIAIRPLAIREKEKFLTCARPYQISTMLVMAGAFLASVHFLYHKPSN
jgi:hypothetical protein